eukprot:CFRG8394T1
MAQAHANPPDREVDFVEMVRRRNTCDMLQSYYQSDKVKTRGENNENTEHMIRDLESQRERNIKREVLMVKDAGLPFGVEVILFQNAMFVAAVQLHTPAYMIGLQFGDQLLSVNDQDVTNVYPEVLMQYLQESTSVSLNVCEQPLSRVFVLKRDTSRTPWGFAFKNRCVASVKDGSPSKRAQIPVGWGIVALNGENILLKPAKEIVKLIAEGGRTGLNNPCILEMTLMPKDAMMEFKIMLTSLVEGNANPGYRFQLDTDALFSINRGLDDGGG